MMEQEVSKSISGVIELRPDRSEAILASDQNGPAQFDITKYAPPGVTINLTEKAGSLFLPHVLNQFAVQAIRRKSDLVIFQCLIRFSLGFNRPICKASNTFIARWTGLHTPHIRRGLKNLKDMGMIKLLNPGEPSGKPTLYEIPVVVGLLNWKMEKERGGNLGRDHIGLRPNRSRQWNQPEFTSKTNPVPKKEKLNKNSKKTLSQLDSLPLNLRTYVLELRPHQKRVEEEYCLSQLLLDYSPEDINTALAFITKNGALDSGELVHSPMKYLSYTVEQVISESKSRHQKLFRAEQLRVQIEQQQEMEQKKREQEEAEFRTALASFETSLTEDEQHTVLNAFFQENYGSSSVIPKSVVRRMAINDWYKRQSVNGPSI